MGIFSKRKKDFKKIKPKDTAPEINPMDEIYQEENEDEELEDEELKDEELKDESPEDMEESSEDEEIESMQKKIETLKKIKEDKMKVKEQKSEQIKVVYLTEAEMLREILVRVQNIESWAANLVSYLKSKQV